MSDLTTLYDGTVERTADGGVIRFERVPHAEERAEARAGEELENWHNADSVHLT